jgi:lipopolysaccharide transport system ATP-binding protein
MGDIAIRVEGLGKRYRIGTSQAPYRMLRETLVELATAPAKRVSAALRGHASPASTNTIWALRDISFEVERGQALGIIGRNGAGKSTLLKILSRITKPTEGRATLNGRVGSLLEVGTGFHPELTGRENIYLNGAILGMRRAEIEQRFDVIVAFAEIERFLDTPVKHYSSGMYVRLAFAVAAHLEPDVLLVDEVLSVGDLAFQRKSMGKMSRATKEEGRTVLLVSHNLAAVRALCSSAVLLRDGTILAMGAVDDVIERYLAEEAHDVSDSVRLPAGAPGGAAAGSRLMFASRDGTPKSQFRLDEAWGLTLEFNVASVIEHFVAAVGITTVDAIPVITYRSVPRDLMPGMYSMKVDVDLPLAACELQFAVGLSSYQRVLYYTEGVARVSISDAARGEQPVGVTGSGLLLNSKKLEVRSIESGAHERTSAINAAEQPDAVNA